VGFHVNDVPDRSDMAPGTLTAYFGLGGKGGTTVIDTPKLPVSHEDRHLLGQE